MNSIRQHRPIVVDLFAGVGGLSLGFEQAGFDIVAAVEFDPIHAATHKINFPRCATICRDIRTISGKEIREAAGLQNVTIDVVVGGPPCQGFSLIGQRVLNDPRNSLVFHYLRLVGELKPRVFVMENVPGLATSPHTKLLTELIEGFQELDYKIRQPYRILNAANFGVPQNRKRLFLLGAKRGVSLPDYPPAITVPPPTDRSVNSNGHLCTPLPSCPTTREAIEDLPDIERFKSLSETDELRFKLNGGSNYALILRGKIQDPTDFSHNRGYDPNVLTGCQRAEHTTLSRKRFAATSPGTVEPISRFYRIHYDGVCNTLRAGTATDRGAFSAPRPIHPAFARCISVREAARLHSYPDWFRFHRTIWHGFRQIGNSVPPRLGRAVGAAVLRALGVEPFRTRGLVALEDTEMASFNMREAADHFGVDRNVIHPRRRAASIGH